jgi:threonine dehydrogenase-like Zn-dependent dehydrogenase
MKALMVEPGRAQSLRIEDISEPATDDGALLVAALAVGVCGTDRELIGGQYGSPPPNHKRLVIGHESLGVVEEAPVGSSARPGDLVIPFVRMPDPEPCDCCAAGEWDRCRNDGFTEHGIRALDGFGRERYRVPPDRVVVADGSLGLAAVLGEPASVVAKAWAVVDTTLGGACWTPRKALVTGAGPVGLLAALIGRQRGLDVHLFDRATDGPKPSLARELGATYHTGDFAALPSDFDIVIECTAAPPIAMQAPSRTRPNGIVCLVGVAEHRPPISVDAAAVNDLLVLGNRIMIGSVNANRAHYVAGHDALRKADRRWLARLITRRVPFAEAEAAFTAQDGDVKTVIVFERARGLVDR